MILEPKRYHIGCRSRRAVRAVLVTLVSAVVLATAPAVQSATTTPGAAEEYFSKALQFIEEGKGRAAIIELRNVLQLDPDSHEARQLLGKLRLLSGDPAAAEKDLRLALEIQHSDETEILLGRALVEQLKFDDVIRMVSRDALVAEDVQQKLLILADAYWGLEQLDSVERLYAEILESWPNNRNARLGEARLLVARQQRGSAERLTDTILAEHPDFVEAWVLKADLAIHERNTDRARSALDQALAIDPDHVNALIHRARLSLESGNWDEADADIGLAQSLQPRNPFVIYLRTAHQFAMGDLIDADGNFALLETMLPDDPPVLLLGTLIKIGFAEYGQSERLLTRYVNQRPQNSAAQRILGLTLIRQDNAITAANVLQELVAQEPDDSAALHLLATAYLQLGRHGLASRMLQQILLRGRADAEGIARSGLIEMAEAVGIGGWAPDEDTPLLPEGLANQVFTVVDLIRSRELEQARDQVRILKRNHPDNPFMLTLEGIVLAERGGLDAARASFERALHIEPEFLVALDQLDRQDLQTDHPERIEPRMRELLLRRPRSEGLTLRLADYLARNNGVRAAIEFLEEKRIGFIESIPIARQLINAHLAVGTLDRPVQITDEILITHANKPRILAFVRDVLDRVGAYERAVDVSRRLTIVEPHSVEQRIGLAKALVRARQPEEAREVLLVAQEMEPSNIEVARGLIGFALERDDIDAAILQAEQIRPYDEAMSDRLHGQVLIRTARLDEAVALLKSAYEKAPTSETAIDLYYAIRRSAGMEPAMQSLQAHLDQFASDKRVRHALASSLIESERLTDAMAHYEALIGADENDVIALNNLAWLRDKLGYDDALDYARRAYEITPDAPHMADTYGWLLVGAEQVEEGIIVLRRAVAQAPRDPDVRYRLAYALNEAGQTSEAKKVLLDVLGSERQFEERSNAEKLMQILQHL